MKNLTRIEKSAFRRGEYVGYCNGTHRIIKSGSMWIVPGLIRRTGDCSLSGVHARTLEELNDTLEALAKRGHTPQAAEK